MEKKPNLPEADNKENSTINENKANENNNDKDFLVRMKAMRLAIREMAMRNKATEKNLKKK
ncbi:hypothetical protein [Flavobacterium yafengii]|uniref:Uncharacterized protein n=1 Tax=Flavobacterium yafengii TaxID=3041253 RepID=A0AAW6TN52_9FLAO|nr:hypothetical protein [Flavobacterium yafengii]MDI5949003.1 hypothetical protein [Flavobacterium yafengii]